MSAGRLLAVTVSFVIGIAGVELSFLNAVREQLGLRLVPSKGAVRTLVVDHVERPSEN
jgi:uncharacterized protein (TIGR03435 family)